MSIPEVRDLAHKLHGHHLRNMVTLLQYASVALVAAQYYARNIAKSSDVDPGSIACLQSRLEDIGDLITEYAPHDDGFGEHIRSELHEKIDALTPVLIAANKTLEEEASRNCHSLTDRKVRQKVFEMTGGKCAYCDVQVSLDGKDDDCQTMRVEHVVPSSHGGPDNLANYVPACGSCNSAKRDRHVLHFVRNTLPRRQERLNFQVIEGDKNAAGGTD